MNTLSVLQSAILSLAKKFAQRQSVVLEAMRDLRPDLIMQHIDKVGTPEQWFALRQDYIRRTQTGFWGENNEWAYFLHGPGCRLTHVETGEIVEWDVGDLKTFNFNWFVKNLHSLIKCGRTDDDIDVVRSVLQDAERTERMDDDALFYQRHAWEKQIRPILEELCDLGFLSRWSSYTYRIVK